MVRGHAEAVMPLIARVMDAARCEFADLDRIAVTVGPGSFTGLRVGISAARGIALAAGKPAIGLSTLSALAAPHVAARADQTIIAAIDARNEQVYFHVFAPNGRRSSRRGSTACAPRCAPCRSGRRSSRARAAALVAAHWPSGSPAPRVEVHAAPDIGWVARLGAAAQDEGTAAEAALSAPARRAPAGRRPAAAPMSWLARLFARAEPALSPASPRDAASLAALHAASFSRGWSEQRVRAAAHRSQRDCRTRNLPGGATVGFILSRRAADEAEILSVAVARAWRGRGLARRLLDLHLRRLAGLAPARRVPGSRRGQYAGAAALRARRISRGRAPSGLLCAIRRQERAGAAPGPCVRRGRRHDRRD